MTAAAVVVGVSLAIILAIAAVFTLMWRKRVRRQRGVTPEQRYQRDILGLRYRPQPTWRDKRRGKSYGTGGSDSTPPTSMGP